MELSICGDILLVFVSLVTTPNQKGCKIAVEYHVFHGPIRKQIVDRVFKHLGNY